MILKLHAWEVEKQIQQLYHSKRSSVCVEYLLLPPVGTHRVIDDSGSGTHAHAVLRPLGNMTNTPATALGHT